MLPTFRSPLRAFGGIRGIRRRVSFPRRRPSRLTLAVAAATVATAVTGITVASVEAGGTPQTSAVSSADVAGRATAPGAAAHTAIVRSGKAITVSPASSQDHGATAAPATPAVAPPAPAAHPAATPAARPAAPPAPAPPPQPYLIYDSVLPSAIPAGNATAAVYATGQYAASPSQVAGRPVLWIDTTGTDNGASALDVEPGNVTPSQAGTWAYNRLRQYPNAIAILYTFRNEWPQVQAAVAALPSWMQSHIRWWIADPTGVPHIVPGSQATQWAWGQNYDTSTALPGF